MQNGSGSLNCINFADVSAVAPTIRRVYCYSLLHWEKQRERA
jgi:hypothetical protein